MKEIQLGSTIYEIPEQGESPTYGEQLTDYLSAIADTVNGLIGPYDSNNKLFTFTNSVTAFTDITGASIDPTAVDGAILTYAIRRTSSSVTATEAGQLTITYNSSNSTSAKFDTAQFKAGSAGFTFYVADDGNVQYQSTDLAGSGYTNRLRYSIKAFEI